MARVFMCNASAIGDHGATPTHAQIWADGLRGIIKEIVAWWREARSCDRFELERRRCVRTPPARKSVPPGR